MWRGGLSDRRTAPLGCEATPILATATCQAQRVQCFATASQPNGGKPPRHRARSYRDCVNHTRFI